MATNTEKRRHHQRGVETRTRLVEAALAEFAQRGFDGASTRAIATSAGVAQSAVRHHFETKEALWKAAVDHVFGLLRARFESRVAGLAGVEAPTRARLLLRDLVYFSAAHPELNRFMVQEGSQQSTRLEWLVENHVRPIFTFLIGQSRELEALGTPVVGSRALAHYMVIGAASAPYSLAAEYELVTGEDPFAKEGIEAHADAVVALFLPKTKQETT